MQRITEAVDYALTKGLLKYDSQFKLTHAPFCLTPFKISFPELEFLKELTPVYNELMVKVGNNKAFLKEHLSPSAETDSFIAKLLGINAASPLSHHLQISRNDFLLTTKTDESGIRIPKQVEFNTISNSFPYLATKLCMLHQYLMIGLDCAGTLEQNSVLEQVVDTMNDMVRHYGHPNAKVLMVVQAKEQNIFDQRGIEFALYEKYGITTLRLTLEEIAARGNLQNGHLEIDGEIIALAYFRAGYTPNDYSTEDAWKGRELIEQSSTIKCPSVGMQLAGAKKIQQVLTKPDILSEFLSADQVKKIHKTFVGLHALDELVENTPAYHLALESPEKYVLKPQREGGGNNLYDEEMVRQLKAMTADQRKAFILMEKIDAETERSVLVVDHTAEETDTVSEIGRYAACFFDGKEITTNKDMGYLVRTKSANVNEGGVCAGYACLNSLCVT